jgi:heme-degrading monooxygenase HmoA
MTLESVLLYVKDGQDQNFERDFKEAGKYIASVKGYICHSLHRCLEHKGKYLLSVEWEKLEDHTVGFRQSVAYQGWKNLLHHYYDPFPIVEHYELVLKKNSAMRSS